MIIVHERNRAKIEKAIVEAQGKSRERTITADDVLEFCTRILGMYAAVYDIHKTDLEGSSFDVDRYAQDFPKAYKWRPTSTQFHVIYEKGRFVLLSVTRDYTRPSGKKVIADLSERTKIAIIERASMLRSYCKEVRNDFLP